MSTSEPSTEIELHVWPSDFGLASIDVECLQAMVSYDVIVTFCII